MVSESIVRLRRAALVTTDSESRPFPAESKLMNEHITACALRRPSNTLDPPSEGRF